MADSKRRSARQLAERKRSIYFEPDSDDEEYGKVDSEGEEDFQPEPHTRASDARPPQKKKRKVERKSKPQTRATEKRMQRLKATGKPRGRKPKKYGVNWLPLTPSKNKDEVSKGFTGPTDGRIPDWTRLPAEILREIFIFASEPIHEQTTTASTNVSWLIRSARICRVFAVPALEAYYQSPAIHTSLQPHRLVELLRRPQESLYMNYKYRIKSMAIDVKRLTYSAHQRGPFQLGSLVQELPRLQSLEITHPMDTSPYRSMKYQPWTYPLDLVSALEAGGVRLKCFRWNREMVPLAKAPQLYDWMTEVHNSKPFEYLERLTVCKYDYKDSAEPQSETDGAPRPPGLASAVSSLPHLKQLTFISCDIVMEDFLERIPRNLERLELSNCLEVTSDMLYTYLAQGGSHLRELVLNHNAALNLEFLQSLKTLCPRLEVLKADLTVYSERINFNDAWAIYDHVLTVDHVPTWPSTLRHLELIHLQKWDAEAAQNLFRSLVDGAKDLTNLRYLALQAHVDIPWRDRARFRDQWIERLQRVYLRKTAAPNPNLGSLKQFRLWKQSQTSVVALRDAQDSSEIPEFLDSDKEMPTRRTLSHVRISPRKPPSDVPLFSDGGSIAEASKRARPRRSVRVAESQSASTAAEESSESEDESEDDWRKQPEAFIQGLCDVVDIRIDNQRPRENQYTEANFLDSEPSGDEDWHSGAELSGDDGYAW